MSDIGILGRRGEQRFFEWTLVAVVCGIAALLYHVEEQRISVLSLVFLPTVLAGFFLGRYRTGVLCLLAVILVSVVTTTKLPILRESPVLVGLEITVWAAVLGLTAILVGTLSDERLQKSQELHEAYVGVVDVLAKYLQRGSQQWNDRSNRVAQWSEHVAQEVGLSQKEADDIRVAALLQDMGSLEITTRIIRRAVDSLEHHPESIDQYTFHGRELVHALGSVLRGALPILLHQDLAALESDMAGTNRPQQAMPLGAEIIEMVREFDSMVHGHLPRSPEEALQTLSERASLGYKPSLVTALERVVRHTNRASELAGVS